MMSRKNRSLLGIALLALGCLVYVLVSRDSSDHVAASDPVPDPPEAVAATAIQPDAVKAPTTNSTAREITAIDFNRTRVSDFGPAEVPVVAVTGTVIDGGANTPVSGIEVMFEAVAVSSALTDAAGRYTMQVLPGHYAVSIIGDGYVIGDGYAGAREQVLVTGEGPQTVNLTVTRTAVVNGQVVDGSGEPMVEAKIDAHLRNDQKRMQSISHMWKFGVEPAQNVTGDDGRFAVALRAGRPILISAKAPSGAVAEHWLQKVTGGGSYDIRIVLDASARITGRVTLADGRPARAATVYVITYGKAGQKLAQRTKTDESGRYTFDGVAPSSRAVVEAKLADVGQSPAVKKTVTSGEVSEIDLALSEARSIGGRVIDGRGTGLPGIEVYARAYGSEVYILTKSDADGAFRLLGLAATKYQVGAQDTVLGRSELPEVPGGAIDVTIKLASK